MKLTLRNKRLTGKFHFTRWGIVVLAVVVALGSVGITYAAWSGQGKGKGKVVHTDYFSDPFSWVVSNDSGQVDNSAIDSDDTGPDPKAPQSIGENTCDRYDKDVASTTAGLVDPYNITVTISNAYPCYYPTIFYGIINDGTVTGGIDSIIVDEDTTTPEVYPEEDAPELTVTYSGIYVGQEIDAGEEVMGNLAIHVEQCAAQGATYTIRVKIVTSAPECGPCEGKVTQLTLQYNGTEEALIKVVQKKNKVVFEDTVQPGGEFTFKGEDKKGTLGTEIEIFVNDELNTKIHTSCSQDIGPGLVSGDFEVIEGYSRGGGLLCPLPPLPDVVNKSTDVGNECKGKVTQLTLQYNGSEAAYIVVEQKKNGTVFADWVAPGTTFTFNGKDKKGTLGTEISIYVNRRLNTKIHTSCSQPIGPGLVSGDFEVVEGYSKDGGKLCPLPPIAPLP